MSTAWVTEIEKAINEWAAEFHPDFKEKHFSGVLARLPEDSILHLRPNKKGLIAVSPKKNLVLKIFLDPKDISRLELEARNLNLFQESSFKEHVPKLLGEGSSKNGAGWVETDVCLDPSFEKKRNAEKYLLKHMDKYFYPVMTKLYVNHGFEVIEAKNWLNEARTRIANHPSKSRLEKLVQLIEAELKRFPEYKVVKTHIHHDLHRGNILTRKDHITIIDWEGMIKGLVLVDVFDFPKRVMKKSKLTEMIFFLYLKGYLKSPPGVVKSFFLNFRIWMDSTFQVRIPEESVKLSFMLYLLERALNSFEGRGVDRFKHRKDFDYKMLSTLGIE